MLAIFASDAIALPLSPAFPTGELKYIMDNSQARMLLATEKYSTKAMEILREGLEHDPIFNIRNKLEESSKESVTLEDLKQSPSSSGMMLYTSGTTNRPVRYSPQA